MFSINGVVDIFVHLFVAFCVFMALLLVNVQMRAAMCPPNCAHTAPLRALWGLLLVSLLLSAFLAIDDILVVAGVI